MNEIASRYGTALFMLAKEKNSVICYQEEVKTLMEVLEENDEFINVLSSAFLSLNDRKDLVKKTLVNFNDDILNLIYLVIDNERASLLMEILDSFNSLANQFREVDEGFIYSALDLSKSQVEEITSSISKIEGHPVFLKCKIDKRLIGGVKVVINDHVYDGSIKSKLQNLKTTLTRKEGK